MRRVIFLETVSGDLVFALRTMRRNRIFAVVAVLILALGIGANTACFSVIRSVLLRPLRYRQPDQLVIVAGGATPVRFEEMVRASRSFSGIGAFTGQENVTLTGGVQPEIVRAARVSADFCQIFGVRPVLGRSFLPEEDTPAGSPVAMIGAEFWEKRFQSDFSVIGRTIDLAGVTHTIVGILPTRFGFPFPGLDIWLPRPSEWPVIAPKSRALSPFLTLFGRLKPGVTIQEATAETRVLQQQYALQHPAMLDAKPKSPARVKPLKEEIVGAVQTELWMMFGAVGFVLLIACANLASLLLARAHGRSREFAVRAALGASRGQIVRQLLTESLFLSMIGGALGILLAFAGLGALRDLTVWTLPRGDEIHLNAAVLVFALILTCVTGIVTGALPALAASRSDPISVLRARSGGSGQGFSERWTFRFDLRGILVAGQVALSIVLLVGAALLMESVIHLRSEKLGFDSAGLLTARISLPAQRYETDHRKAAFFRDLIQRLERQPGVQSATAAMTLPMTGFAGSPVQDADKPLLRLNDRPIATILVVDSEYFKTLKIPIRRGRTFSDRDREDTQPMAVIDEGLARRFWPAYPNGEDPVGHRLRIGGTNPQPAEIIGVVGNVHQNVENTAWPESVYIALPQNALASALIAVRIAGDPSRAASVVQGEVGRLDRDLPLSDVQTMQGRVEAEFGERRTLTLLLGFFAGVATLLALVGIYGVAAYSVSERTKELGIRRALGARDRAVLWLIMGHALRFSLLGTVAGLGGAFVLTRFIGSLLFHVTATDPETIGGIAALFIFVTVGASYLPARRVTDLDPMIALRYE